jgi:CelD/BcsL family acetyltransferase involved in cellulose biosynthesis
MPLGTASGLSTYLLDGFDDERLGRDRWNALVARGSTDVVFLTWEFQRAWWDAFGAGELLFVGVERDDETVAVAPFWTDEWSISFVGEQQAEWLDVIGAVDGDVVRAVVETARERAQPSAQFDLHTLPGRAGRLAELEVAAGELGLSTWQVADDLVPVLDLERHPEAAGAGAEKTSLVRHERFFRRHGELAVEHLSDGHAIRPHLADFFDQHVARWAVTEDQSPFAQPEERRFIERLTELAAETGWLRFTRVLWDGRPIAYHFGFLYGGRFHWWRPSFAVDLARRSPGEVLLRQLLLHAIDQQARVFDFGLGVVPFKERFATSIEQTCYWGTNG